MNNKLAIFALLSSTALTACAQLNSDAQMTFRVKDEFGSPVSNAVVAMSTFDHLTSGGDLASSPISKIVTGSTDRDGMVTLNCAGITRQYGYTVKDISGYYRNLGQQYTFLNSTNGQWQPWNPTVEIVLRPIVNPVPMYARSTEKLVLPEVGKEIGYDLETGDWVVPFGKGIKSDILFRMDRKSDSIVRSGPYHREHKLFDATLTVSFPNPDDGIRPILDNEKFLNSDLKLPRTAPEEPYGPNLVLHTWRTNADQSITSDFNKGQDYFYRVRTVRQNDKIVSALYGKIVRGINFDVINSNTAVIIVTYYLNPEPNSRNVEFDTSKNLYKVHKKSDPVLAP